MSHLVSWRESHFGNHMLSKRLGMYFLDIFTILCLKNIHEQENIPSHELNYKTLLSFSFQCHLLIEKEIKNYRLTCFSSLNMYVLCTFYTLYTLYILHTQYSIYFRVLCFVFLLFLLVFVLFLQDYLGTWG